MCVFVKGMMNLATYTENWDGLKLNAAFQLIVYVDDAKLL
jgi:hypothetical protein